MSVNPWQRARHDAVTVNPWQMIARFDAQEWFRDHPEGPLTEFLAWSQAYEYEQVLKAGFNWQPGNPVTRQVQAALDAAWMGLMAARAGEERVGRQWTPPEKLAQPSAASLALMTVRRRGRPADYAADRSRSRRLRRVIARWMVDSIYPPVSWGPWRLLWHRIKGLLALWLVALPLNMCIHFLLFRHV